MDLGDFKLYSLSDGAFRLDGGAVFGIVPKTLWEKTNEPDELNRIALGINPLLIMTGADNILVDTGIGDKWDDRSRSIYAIDRTATLTGSLAGAGLKPSDITVVINTHLHFDHAGGNTFIGPEGALRPAFPNARHIVQRGEWEAANAPNERTRASYRQDDFLPVMKEGLLELVEGDREVVTGVSVFRTSGHNRDIQLVRISSGGSSAVYLSDIIPTVAHLRYPYIMGYDLFPLDTLRAKKEILERASRERSLLVFGHDPAASMGFVRIEEDVPVFEKVS
ncbi:MAG TPA: MBL fold metallo-hydrolase [Thermodesulfobacteriota bacterium]|nr:MBL fold metallo-hydrolase [Thermodesulfobacteriota bacterium]